MPYFVLFPSPCPTYVRAFKRAILASILLHTQMEGRQRAASEAPWHRRAIHRVPERPYQVCFRGLGDLCVGEGDHSSYD
jgi:hypothetical protein